MKSKKHSEKIFDDDYIDNDGTNFKNKKSHKLRPIKKEKSKNFINSFYDQNDEDEFPDEFITGTFNKRK
jgi:hypothetical protein